MEHYAPMPQYDYYCPQCDRSYEERLPMDHEPPTCPDCVLWADGKRVTVQLRRLYNRPPLIPPSRVQQ